MVPATVVAGYGVRWWARAVPGGPGRNAARPRVADTAATEVATTTRATDPAQNTASRGSSPPPARSQAHQAHDAGGAPARRSRRRRTAATTVEVARPVTLSCARRGRATRARRAPDDARQGERHPGREHGEHEGTVGPGQGDAGGGAPRGGRTAPRARWPEPHADDAGGSNRRRHHVTAPGPERGDHDGEPDGEPRQQHGDGGDLHDDRADVVGRPRRAVQTVQGGIVDGLGKAGRGQDARAPRREHGDRGGLQPGPPLLGRVAAEDGRHPGPAHPEGEVDVVAPPRTGVLHERASSSP